MTGIVETPDVCGCVLWAYVLLLLPRNIDPNCYNVCVCASYMRTCLGARQQ